jgi:hypothetical protein
LIHGCNAAEVLAADGLIQRALTGASALLKRSGTFSSGAVERSSHWTSHERTAVWLVNLGSVARLKNLCHSSASSILASVILGTWVKGCDFITRVGNLVLVVFFKVSKKLTALSLVSSTETRSASIGSERVVAAVYHWTVLNPISTATIEA